MLPLSKSKNLFSNNVWRHCYSFVVIWTYFITFLEYSFAFFDKFYFGGQHIIKPSPLPTATFTQSLGLHSESDKCTCYIPTFYTSKNVLHILLTFKLRNIVRIQLVSNIVCFFLQEPARVCHFFITKSWQIWNPSHMR